MNLKPSHYVAIAGALIAGGLIALGGVSEAKRHYANKAAFAEMVARCDYDDGYFKDHASWCESAERHGYVKLTHRRAQAFPAVQGFDEVTVSRDRHASTDTGNPDPLIRMQTAQNVANSSPWYGAWAAAFNPGSWTIGVHHVARAVIPEAQPRPIRTVAAPAQHPTRVTTNGGPVYITNSHVTVAQQ